MFKYPITACLIAFVHLVPYTFSTPPIMYLDRNAISTRSRQADQSCSINDCGTNAVCSKKFGRPNCSCLPGCIGDPYSGCQIIDPPRDLCDPTPCGLNTKCQVNNGIVICSCLSGYVGSAFDGCHLECESDEECSESEICQDYQCISACTQCGSKALCQRCTNHRAVCECPEGYIGTPYTECRVECYADGDCSGDRPICFNGVCKNPYGKNADCKKTFIGNPLPTREPCPKIIDSCNPNPCGENAQCIQSQDYSPVCTCLPGYTGNALIGCFQCECFSNFECGFNSDCLANLCVSRWIFMREPLVAHYRSK